MFPNVVVVVVDVVVVVVGCGEDRRLVCLEVLENPRACHWYHLRKKFIVVYLQKKMKFLIQLSVGNLKILSLQWISE